MFKICCSSGRSFLFFAGSFMVGALVFDLGSIDIRAAVLQIYARRRSRIFLFRVMTLILCCSLGAVFRILKDEYSSTSLS